jgi:hypothetical protein
VALMMATASPEVRLLPVTTVFAMPAWTWMAAPLRDAAGLNPAQRAVQVTHDGDLSSINATILNRLRVLR